MQLEGCKTTTDNDYHNGSGSNSTGNSNNPVMDLINVLMVKEAKNLNK